jgi:EpsI family protein
LASVLLVAQATLYYTFAAKEYIPAISAWSEFPKEIGNWHTATEMPIDQESLAALKPDDYLNRNYVSQNGGATVNLLVVYFNTRRSGHAPHSPEWCLPGAGWKDVSSQIVKLWIPETGPQEVNEYIVQKGEERQLVLYWYHQGRHTAANEVVAQVYALPEMILHGRTDTALVRIIARIQSEIERARGDAFQFARDIFPFIRTQLH